jgi:hypothetical protein
MKLYADTTNGVKFSGDDDHVTEIMTQKNFFDSLSDLSDSEYIMCEDVSENIVNLIKQEYGIK